VDDWIEDDWLDDALAWIEGAMASVAEAVVRVGGRRSKRKPPQGYAPKLVTDKEFTKQLIAEIRAKEESEEEKRRQVELSNAEFERREHFRKLGQLGAERKKFKRLEEERKRLERDNNLARGREVRKQAIIKVSNTQPKSETARVVERKRANKQWGERMAKRRKGIGGKVK